MSMLNRWRRAWSGFRLANKTHGGRAPRGRTMFEAMEQRCLMSTSAVWTIRGDIDKANPNDQIVVQVDPADAGALIATVNGQIVDRHIDVDRLRTIRVVAGKGDDNVTINLEGVSHSIRALLYGGQGNDSLTGSFGDDVLFGGPGDDTLTGAGGNDRLYGSTGDDDLFGDGGNDRLYGSSGDDNLIGGDGDDSVSGGGGDDNIVGGFGDDRVIGGGGDDEIHGNEGIDDIRGGSGFNLLAGSVFIDRMRVTKRDTVMGDDNSHTLSQIPNGIELIDFFVEAAVDRWRDQLGTTVDYRWDWFGWRGGVIDIVPDIAFSRGVPMGAVNDGIVTADGAPSSPSVQMGAPGALPGSTVSAFESTDFDGTNVQVTGVDESDIVKTNGSYIFLVDNDKVLIIDADPDGNLDVVNTITVDGPVDGLYLEGDALTVVTSEYFIYPLDRIALGAPGAAVDALIAPDWWHDYDPTVTVTQYDVSDVTNPVVVETNKIDGSKLDTRRIGDDLYLVVSNIIDLPAPAMTEIAPGVFQYATEEEYRAQLAETIGEQSLPEVVTTDALGNVTTEDLITGDSVFVGPDMDGQNLVTLVRINVTDSDPGIDASTTVLGLRGTVYASQDNMYFAAQSWQSPTVAWRGAARTDIVKFSLGEEITPEGVGSVPGWIRDSFALDEYDGHLRVATTDSFDELANSVFVLDDTGDSLDIVGEVTGLAPGQRIFSTRFVGDRGYVVTFRQVDPLHVIDLSDPTAPFEAGFLELPGFSTYLHPVDANHLLGFGRDVDSSGRATSLKLTLFDVTDAAHPTEVDSLIFNDGKGYSFSEAEWDHKAFSYFASRGVAAMPIGGGAWGEPVFGLSVVDVDPSAGLDEIGQVPHNAPVRRSLRIDDYLYSVGSDALKLVPIDEPDNVLAELPLSQYAFPGDVIILN